MQKQVADLAITTDGWFGVNTTRNLRSTDKIIKSIGRMIFLIGMCFVMLYPVLFILSSAFKTLADIYNPSVVWIPRSFNLQPLKIAMDIMQYPTAILKSIRITVVSVGLQLIAVLLAGYGFARFKFPGRRLLFGLLIFTIIVPVQSYIIPLYVNLKNFDFFGIGTLIGFITGTPLTKNLLDTNLLFYLQAIFGMGIRSGLCIFIIRQFFKNMPVELEEAATIDGCGPFGTFLKVMIPNTLPLITTVTVFSVVWYWNDFFLSSMFFRAEFPVSVNLTFLSTLLTTSDNVVSGISSQELLLLKEPILASGCLITILPIILMYVFAQRYFTEGVERSGIVG
ncbi:MAG: carbohydrate ABC transporter permease [Oscillospiraceae bacterium]|nr:carbohydrate ABC transporter permease [Oscillospiraceae bacterium]MDD4545672.1 carbohydrate ABC transporter permease [Oscillospiraceae bacterium]